LLRSPRIDGPVQLGFQRIDGPVKLPSPDIHVLYASQTLQTLAPCQPSVNREPQNVPVVLARRPPAKATHHVGWS
jgi:hypothetical protein